MVAWPQKLISQGSDFRLPKLGLISFLSLSISQKQCFQKIMEIIVATGNIYSGLEEKRPGFSVFPDCRAKFKNASECVGV